MGLVINEMLGDPTICYSVFLFQVVRGGHRERGAPLSDAYSGTNYVAATEDIVVGEVAKQAGVKAAEGGFVEVSGAPKASFDAKDVEYCSYCAGSDALSRADKDFYY